MSANECVRGVTLPACLGFVLARALLLLLLLLLGSPPRGTWSAISISRRLPLLISLSLSPLHVRFYWLGSVRAGQDSNLNLRGGRANP